MTPELFEREAAVMAQAQRVLDDPALTADPLHGAFAELLAAYRKLAGQSVRLVRISDRWQRELKDLNELKNRFLGMAAHDLRNPAAAIRSLSALMVEADLDETTRIEFLQDIHQASGEMLALLEELLDVSVIESGRLLLRTAPLDLATLVDARVRMMSPLAVHKGIGLDAWLRPVPPCVADAHRLSQVIDNLISNALKFSEPGTRVQVDLEERDGEACISVQDQGPGIPAEEQAKLFGLFQRTSVQPTGGERSTGLGLAIVKKVVGAHGGRIEVDSSPGRGSTFHVRLPLHPPAGAPAGV